jgi:predicted  nucleic acid-binding Zn-ribbon protein
MFVLFKLGSKLHNKDLEEISRLNEELDTLKSQDCKLRLELKQAKDDIQRLESIPEKVKQPKIYRKK